MLKDLMKKVVAAVQRFEDGFNQPVELDNKAVENHLHKIDVKVKRLEKRIGNLEAALLDLQLQKAQIKGEFVAEMRHAHGKEAEGIKEAYYKIKAEIDAVMDQQHKELNNCKRRLNVARL